MPHSDHDPNRCPYCGWGKLPDRPTCRACSDLPECEPLDDRYAVRHDGRT